MFRNTTQLLLTKGDNNPQDDYILYKGIEYLEPKHIIGKVRGYVYFLPRLSKADEQVLAVCGLCDYRYGKLAPPRAVMAKLMDRTISLN